MSREYSHVEGLAVFGSVLLLLCIYKTYTEVVFVHLFACVAMEQPVLCLCILWGICSQYVLPSYFRSVFSILTCAMGLKTMNSAHALYERSQSTSFVPGGHF